MSSPTSTDSDIELVKVRKTKPWMTKELLLLIRKKDRVYKRNKQHPSEKNLKEGKEIKSYLQQQIRKAKYAYEVENPTETTSADQPLAETEPKMADDEDAGSDCSSTEHGGAALKFKAERIEWDEKSSVQPVQPPVATPAASAADTKLKTNLIVNYLPQTLSDDSFYGLFSAIGPIKSHKVVRDVNTGYNYGFGFVDFVSEYDASEAIKRLNGLKLQHKTIKVAYARPSSDKTKNCNLYISGLVPDTDNDILIGIFSKFGEIVHSRVLVNPVTKKCTGAGFVLFSNTDECDAAILSLNGVTPDGWLRPIAVKYSKPKGSTYSTPIGAQSNAGPIRNDKQYKAVRQQVAPIGREQGVVTDPSLAQRDELGVILFIRNFPLDTDEEKMYSLFAPFGSVRKVKIMRDAAGNGRGFGFITMYDDSAAVTAVLKLNRSTFGGRIIEVRFKLKEGESGNRAVTASVQAPYIPSMDMKNRMSGIAPGVYQEQVYTEQYSEPEGFSISQQALMYANQQRMQQQNQASGISMGSMNANMGGMNTNMGGMNTNMGGMNTNMMGMNSNMGGMNANMVNMNTNMSGMNPNMIGRNANVGGRNTNMGGVNTNMGGMNTNMGGMNTNMGGRNTNMGGMNMNMMGMNTNMANMNANMMGKNTNMGGMNSNMMGGRTSMGGMNANMGGMNANALNMTANMANMNTNVPVMNRVGMRAQGLHTQGVQIAPFEDEQPNGGLFDYLNL